MSGFQMTMVSHACIKLETEQGNLLCDPWFLNEPIYDFTTWKFPAAVLSPEEITKDVKWLYISHTHEDHFHVPSIDHVPRDVTILLPRYTWKDSERAFTSERVMRALGFENFLELEAWQSHRLTDDLTVTMVPAARSKARDWENSGLVVEHGTCRLLNMNDNPADLELYEEIVRRFPRFDLGLVQYAGVTIFPGRFRMSQEEMRAAVQKRRANLEQQRLMIENLPVETIVPFAGDFCWLDDDLYHCNWACRATPRLLTDFVETNYPDKDIGMLPMNPGDVWTPENGIKRNHPEINWNNYLAEIDRLRDRLKPRITAVRTWLEESDKSNLEARSRTYLENIERLIGNEDIDFNIRVRFRIEATEQPFSFVMSITEENGFRILWNDQDPTDQTFYLREHIWASLLAGKILMSQMTWAGEIEQHRPFVIDMAKFWFWTEYYTDLNTRNPQVILDDRQFPWLKERVRPQLGVANVDAMPKTLSA